MFRLWTWGGKKKSSICSIWVASFMEDLSLNSKKVNFHFTTFKYTFMYTWIREHYELWTIPFPFTTESIQTEPLIINLYTNMIICSFHVRGITIFFTRYACLPPRSRQQPPNKNHVAFPATSCFSRRFVGRSFLEVLDLSQVELRWFFLGNRFWWQQIWSWAVLLYLRYIIWLWLSYDHISKRF